MEKLYKKATAGASLNDAVFREITKKVNKNINF